MHCHMSRPERTLSTDTCHLLDLHTQVHNAVSAELERLLGIHGPKRFPPPQATGGQGLSWL